MDRKLGRLITACAILTSVYCIADDTKHGKWVTSEQGDTVLASTEINKNYLVSYMCSAANDQCLLVLMTTSACTANVKTPILLNKGASVMSASINCLSSEAKLGLYALAFSDAEKAMDFISTGEIVGLSLPMETGRYESMKINARGMLEAIDDANSRIDKLIAAKEKR